MPHPEIVAHRGWARRYPENTLLALEAAIQAGARWVEIDVQLSADGYPVLFHDRDLQRMCGVPGAIHELTLSQLRALPCHEPRKFGERFHEEGIASLGAFAQLLLRFPEVRAFVEIKRVALERFGNEVVLEKALGALEPARAQCALISFSLPFLHVARRTPGLSLGAVFDRWSERDQASVWDLAPEYVFCDLDGLPAQGELKHESARTAIYEVADPAVARALGARGVELVESFAVGEMIAALREAPQERP